MEASPMAALDVLKLACRPVAAEGRVLVWTSTERGEGRSFAGYSSAPAQGPRASRRRSMPVCSSTERGLSQTGEKATVNFPRAMAIGSMLHLEWKP